MTDKPPKPDLDHLKWAIERRADIQRTLHALYSYVRTNQPQQLFTTVLLDHCIAAAFSLWRAVFLADKVRTISSTHEAQEQFLETVVTTNAINFPDDRKNSAWTVSFYLENAKHRLSRGAIIASRNLGLQDEDGVISLLRSSGTDVAMTRYEWECAHLALRTLFNVITPAAFTLELIQPSSPEQSPLLAFLKDDENE
jgi:hypothetical protein